ncbi:major capsid protein [Capybara microvirus Cap1_SP_93]|nr:major capsid protein [Capybara microvirus Cap1_SP_93]
MANNTIRVGKPDLKRKPFDLTCTNNTSSDWGFYQPIFARELTPNDKISIDMTNYIRFSPMPQPTFSKGVHYYQFGAFVAYEDLYKPFANLLSGQPYRPFGETSSYIPNEVPFVTNQWLWTQLFLRFGTFTIWSSQTSTTHLDLMPRDQAVSLATEFVYQVIPRSSVTYNWDIQVSYDPDDVTVQDKSINPSNCDYCFFGDDTHAYKVICFRLDRAGRNLRKILLGLGFHPDPKDMVHRSFLPIAAYYKGWFDTLYPQRYTTWTDTNLYHLMDFIAQKNHVNLTYWSSFQSVFDELKSFFHDDLPNCFHTYDPDYFSAQTGGVSLEKTPSSISITSPDNNTTSPIIVAGQNQQAHIQASTAAGLGGYQLWLIEKLTKFVNKNTIVGGRIKEYLISHGLGQYVDDHNSDFLKFRSTPCNVFDVDQNTPTATSPLGNYAGKGIGSATQKWTYETNCFGHIIIYGAMVPICGYFQGTNPMNSHTTRYSFYHPEFDAMGLVASRCSDIVSYDSAFSPELTDAWRPNDAFGLLPRYTEYKVNDFNVINGDVSLPSRAPGLMGYTLDRWMPTIMPITDNIDTQSHQLIFRHRETDPHVFANGITWRFCGKYDWLGNFNRIFYNSGVISTAMGERQEQYNDYYGNYNQDNFILHHLCKVQLFSGMIPLKDSYFTGDDKNSVELSKS